MRKSFALICVLVGFGITGCASGPKLAEVKKEFPLLAKDQGRVYFYRDSFWGAALSPNIKVNGQVVGESTNGTVFFVDMKPGDYVVETSTEATNTCNFKLAAGETKYVRIYISMGFFVGHPHPEMVNASEAEDQIQGLRFLASKSSGNAGRVPAKVN